MAYVRSSRVQCDPTPLMAPSDETPLLRSAADGSPEAIEALVRRHWNDAYRVALLITHDQGAAEDLAQETILAGLGSLSSFDAERPFLPWLQRIAVNKTLDWLRARQRRPELVVEELGGLATTHDELADSIARTALPEELMEALGRLDQPFRTVVVLRYLLEYTPAEISELLSVPPVTIRTRLHRGLERLRADLTTRGGINERAG
jgi:RNA polymerase sigma-70 factor (ECF subfamily)